MATYDPNKTYTWGPDTKFTLSGQDFSLLLHTVRGILSTKEATNAIMTYELNKKLETMMGEAVAEGRVVEVVAPNIPENPSDAAVEYEEVANDSPNMKKV